MKYYVARQQCKGNWLLHFSGTTEHFYILDTYLCANNLTRGKYCCVSMTRIVTWMRNSVMLYVYCLIMLLLPVASVSICKSVIPKMTVVCWDTLIFVDLPGSCNKDLVITQMTVSRALLLFIVQSNRHKYYFISLCSTAAIYLHFTISAGHIWVPY